jgi:SAGA-associated factor 11
MEEDDANLQPLADSILDELVDHLALGICHQTHRAAKLGFLELEEVAAEEESKYRISNEKGLDVFGESSTVTMKKQYECTCPSCDRTLAASRFAPHLEKCMGMGRNSSRIASKRIAHSSGRATNGNNKDSNGSSTPAFNNNSSNGLSASTADSDLEIDNDKSSDNDWNEKPVVKKPRKKRKVDHHSSSNGSSSTLSKVILKRGVKQKQQQQQQSLSEGLSPRFSCTGRSSPSLLQLHSSSLNYGSNQSRNSPCSSSVSSASGSPLERDLYDSQAVPRSSVRTTRHTSSLLDNHQLRQSPSPNVTSNSTIVQIESQREFEF